MGTLCLFELGLVVAFIGFYICDVEAFGARLVWLVREYGFLVLWDCSLSYSESELGCS
jgi:hypothetical protein